MSEPDPGINEKRGVDIDPAIQREILAGRKIAALRLYRIKTGASLNDGMKAINAYEQQLRNRRLLEP